jgi:hypothetical protein
MPLSAERAKEVDRLLRDNAGPSELQLDLDVMEADLKKVLSPSHPYFNDSVLLRNFLIARKLKLDETLQMLNAHVEWRKANLPVQITDPLIQELKKGKVEVYGKDVKGRPLVIVRSGRFDPKVRDLSVAIAAVVYQVEQAIAAAGKSDTQFMIFYDRTGFSLRHNWDFEFIKTVVITLSDNYPERLGGVFLYPATAVLAGLVAVFKPFMDARTRGKIHTITSDKALLERVPAEYVPVAAGGTSEHVFDPSMFDSLASQVKPSATEYLPNVEIS